MKKTLKISLLSVKGLYSPGSQQIWLEEFGYKPKAVGLPTFPVMLRCSLALLFPSLKRISQNVETWARLMRKDNPFL